MSRGSWVRSPPGVMVRGIGAIGSARALQARGTGIETPMLQLLIFVFFGFGVLRLSARYAYHHSLFYYASRLDGRAV